MATVDRSKRELAEERSANAGEVKNSFKEAGVGAVRSLELNNIAEGEVVTVPKDFKIYQMPISGSTNKAVKTITEEGKDLWIGVFTRGARPADGSDYVRPSGTVVEAAQKHASMDEFFQKDLAGKKIRFTKKTVVVAEYQGETRNVNVWTIDFVK